MKPSFSLSLTSTDDPDAHGRAGYLVADFSGVGDGPAPTGSVTFTDGGATLATVPITFDTLVLPLQGLATGDHEVTATYSGDSTYPAVVSAPFDQTITSSSAKAPKTLAAAAALVWPYARSQWQQAAQSLAASCFPQESRDPGEWTCKPATTWTGGYFPGSALLASADQGAAPIAAVRSSVQPWLDGMSGEASDTSTQDLGLMLLSSLLVDQDLGGDDTAALLQGASSLDSRYDPTTGVLPSFHHTTGTVGIETDQLPGLPLLFWAAANGGSSTLRDHALGMARTAARDLVRSDGSTWHYAYYDPTSGALVGQAQNKGAGDLVWSRGQAWAIDGFAEDYAATDDPTLLAAARSTAAWWIAHQPVVPYDYPGSPAAPDEPTDTSAAAIAALGLLRLAAAEPSGKNAKVDRKAAGKILVALSSPTYLGGTAGLLTDAQGGQVPGDVGSEVVWGDWAFEQALRLATT